MKYVHVVLALFLTMVFVSAAGLTVTMGYVEGTRAVYKDGVVQLSSCDMPEKPQYVTMGLEVEYPEEMCTGLVDLYYSYYDFALGKYTDEELLCVARDGDVCKGRFYLRFGGKGTGTAEMADWAKFRAVCRKNGEEFTSAMPARFSYSPNNIEADIISKVSAADASVASARAALAQCTCCNEFSGTLSQLESQNAANKAELARCELVTLANKAITLKQNADALAESIRMASTRCAHSGRQQETEPASQQAEATPPSEIREEKPTQQKNDQKPPITQPAENELSPTGMCPMGALLLLAAGALAFARKL